MALVLADRVQEYSTTTGTGTLTLSGAYAGFQTFAAGIGNGNTCYYTITSDTNQWEVGIGTVGVGTLARTTLISSSTGSLVSFVGTLTVFVTYPAEKAVYSDSTTIVAPAGALLPVTSGGTGASTAAGARTALGLGTIATQDANAVAITGGTINGTTVGSTTVATGSFSTLNSSGDTRLGGLSGNQSLQVNNVASAVNYAQVVGAVTNGSPTLSAVGTDANIGLYVAPKGTAFLGLGGSTSGTAPLHVFANPSNVNYTEYNGGTSGGAPAIVTGGADANVALSFSTKGSSGFSFYTNGYGSQAVAFSHTASAVNYVNLTGAATGNAPTISAAGSDANPPLVLTGKGTGVVALGGTTAANSGFQVAPLASSVNYVKINGALTGNIPNISVEGSDANINFGLFAKNNGFHFLFAASGVQFAAAPTASAVNYLRATGSATGASPIMAAVGSDTDIGIKLVTKGTGTVQFGTYTAGILAQAGYITITDAGGTSRRLLVG